MEINNENETYTTHFIFHKNILHIKSSRIPVMKNDVTIIYQGMGRQYMLYKTRYMRIHEEKYIQVCIDYLIE